VKSMELDELKAAWVALNAKTAAISYEVEVAKLESAKAKTTGFVRLCIFEILAGLVASIFTGNCLVSGPRTVGFLLPFSLLHIGAILTIIAPTWQLATLKRIDYSQPVVEIQHQLAQIMTARMRFTQGILLSGPLLWALFLAAALGFVGAKAGHPILTGYLVANLVFGLAAIPMLYWIARFIGKRFKGAAWLSRLTDDLGGKSLARALRDLDEVTRFKQSTL